MEDLLNAIDQEALTQEQRTETFETLLKVLGNIVRNPNEPKYRTLKKDNKLVAEKLCRSGGALSVLLALGFDDEGAAYRCPEDADVVLIGEAVDLLECIVASRPSEAAPVAAAPGPGRLAAVPAATKSPASTNGFTRRSDEERRREEQARELEAARAIQRSQFEAGGGAAAVLRAGAPSPSGASSPTSTSASSTKGDGDAKRVPVKTAFDFESRAKKEQQKQSAENGLEDLRRMQREKFKQFEADPHARQAAAYQQPASVAPGGKTDSTWGEWLGGFFGGSGSSGGGGGGGGSRPSDDKKPRMKTINDLPKPVQRG